MRAAGALQMPPDTANSDGGVDHRAAAHSAPSQDTMTAERQRATNYGMDASETGGRGAEVQPALARMR